MTASPRIAPVADLTFEAAHDLVFPTAIAPTSSDAIRAYEWLTSRLGAAGYDAALASLHARALTSDPSLAALLRTPEALDDVATAAMRYAHPATERETTADAQRRAGTEAQDRYRRAIAKQLAEEPNHELGAAARVFLDGIAAADRHAAQRRAAVEAERLERERAAAERRAAERAELDRLATIARQAQAEVDALGEKHLQAHRNARLALRAAVAARLQASGLTELRLGTRGVFSVRDLLAICRVDGSRGDGGPGLDSDLGILAAVEAALERQEAGPPVDAHTGEMLFEVSP